MLWQDVVLSLAGFLVAGTSVPMLRAAVKPPLATSTPLVAMLIPVSFTLLTLGLWLAALGSALQATLWLVLAVMRWRAERAERAAGVSPVDFVERSAALTERAA